MSLITSTYPHTHGMFTPYRDVLAPDITTLPQTLKKAGYHTIYVGETDNSHLPLDKGLGRGFDTIISYASVDDWNRALDLVAQDNTRHIPTFLFLHSFDLNASWRDSAMPPKTFTFDPLFQPPFVYNLNQFDTHIWKNAIAYLQERLSPTPEIQTILTGLREAKTNTEAKLYFQKLPKVDQDTVVASAIYDTIDTHNPASMRYLRDLYDERVSTLDQQLGTFFTGLEAKDFASHTVLAMTSDHGDEYGEHGEISHGTNLYDTTTHIPLIISIPDMTAQRRHDIAQSIDIYPTLLAAVGIKPPSNVRGINLLSGEFNAFTIAQLAPLPWLSSLRTREWSYYMDKTDKVSIEELYNLKNDPYEQHNVVKKFPAEKNTLKTLLDTTQASQPRYIQPGSEYLQP